ncbi:uncharacterized protein LOC112568299 [Pomacea canaliculata]|uniref:uncharacterized protein LOC112568299 n=1 Tax=Pomacea canaliculata TaxID=400727 RepID=UPI000D725A3C|nr:uncharacterized protein LOC112568299 [Pomacea canaliculata]
MDRPANQDQGFLKANILLWLCLALIQIGYAQAPLVKCKVEFNEKCNAKLYWTTEVKYAKRGPVIVAYTTSEGKNVSSLLLPYLGQCEFMGEHTCDEGNNMLFNRFGKITENGKADDADQESKEETEKETFLNKNGELESWKNEVLDKLELPRYTSAVKSKKTRGPRPPS